jgi:uncharacterized membrane protein
MHPSDDDAAVALLRPLDTDPLAPSTVDVDRAVRDGRRRRRRNRATRSVALVAAVGLVAAGGTAAFTTLRGTDAPTPGSTQNVADPGASGSARPVRRPPITVVPPPAPTTCRVSALPVPDGVKKSIVTGGDPTGRILLGRSYLPEGEKQVLVWEDGRVRKIPMVGSDPVLADVTTGGTAVGFGYGPGEEGQYPVVYDGGKVTRLATGDRSGGEASGINEKGTIVGAVGSSRADEQPARWSGPRSQPEHLPVPAAYPSARATDIDEDGTIVGYVGSQGAPYVWFPDGEHRELPVPTLDGMAATESDARSIRNGWVVGMAAYGREMRAVRWNVHTGETTVFPEFTITASAVNAHGWQVGPARTPTGLLRTTTGTVTVPGLPLGDEAHALSVSPKTLSDDGRTIAGQSDDDTNTLRAVVWRCT